MSETSGDLLAQRVAQRVHVPVAALAAVDAIPGSDRVNGMLVVVTADQSVWVYSFTSTAVASSTARVPSDNPTAGRWLSTGSAAGLAALQLTLGSIAKTTWTPVKTANFTAVPHTFVKVNPTGGAFAITLPTAVGLTADDSITVVNDGTSTNAVTVTAIGGQTIKGNGGIAATTYVMNQAGLFQSFVPDGANWYAAPGT